MKTIETAPKLRIKNNEIFSLLYLEGAYESCAKIKEEPIKVFELTNRSNSLAVLSHNYSNSVNRAIFLKETMNTDAYPFEIPGCTESELQLILDTIIPNFMGIDTTLLKGYPVDNREFIPTCSKGSILPDSLKIEEMESAELRSALGGIIETKIVETVGQRKPVAIFSDCSDVMNMGAMNPSAGLSFMEAKALMYKEFGDVDSIPLCLNTQDTNEIKRIILLLENSFSAIDLECIKAPKCFEIEKFLIQNSKIPVLNGGSQCGAIAVLAGIFNTLKITGKSPDRLKIVISGTNALGQTIARMALKVGVKNVVMTDTFGIVYSGRLGNDRSLEAISKITNKLGLKGQLEDAVKNADVFIGVSQGGIFRPEYIQIMAKNPVIFALSMPEAEILPDIAKKFGARVIAGANSNFENLITDILITPGFLDGVINTGIKAIPDEIKITAARELAGILTRHELMSNRIVPEILDAGVAKNISACIIDYVRNLTTEHVKRPV
ncbi:MAG: hypothetical protein LUE64_04820 [Candidatus Gastranaerophilales bacterium]|nr:hypothetical protein [Candidatus Gastranaerophilales bacterium]